jgi:hypothetical protein
MIRIVRGHDGWFAVRLVGGRAAVGYTLLAAVWRFRQARREEMIAATWSRGLGGAPS